VLRYVQGVKQSAGPGAVQLRPPDAYRLTVAGWGTFKAPREPPIRVAGRC
jgi:hypothetical protein